MSIKSIISSNLNVNVVRVNNEWHRVLHIEDKSWSRVARAWLNTIPNFIRTIWERIQPSSPIMSAVLDRFSKEEPEYLEKISPQVIVEDEEAEGINGLCSQASYVEAYTEMEEATSVEEAEVEATDHSKSEASYVEIDAEAEAADHPKSQVSYIEIDAEAEAADHPKSTISHVESGSEQIEAAADGFEDLGGDPSAKTPQSAWQRVSTTINHLQRQTYLSNVDINNYCDYLKFKFPHARVVNECSSKTASDELELPSLPNNRQPILVPIVLAGGEDHIVAAYITFDEYFNATIEFYDSKGLLIGDHENSTLAYKSGLTLKSAIAQIADKYCLGFPKIVQNKKTDQHDCHNCGVYVLNYFEQRLSGEKVQEISKTCNSYSKTIEMRRRMIDNLAQNWQHI